MHIIEKLRRDKGLTQVEAAQIAGMTPALWGRAEGGGSITFRSLKKISSVLPELKNVKLEDLLK